MKFFFVAILAFAVFVAGSSCSRKSGVDALYAPLLVPLESVLQQVEGLNRMEVPSVLAGQGEELEQAILRCEAAMYQKAPDGPTAVKLALAKGALGNLLGQTGAMAKGKQQFDEALALLEGHEQKGKLLALTEALGRIRADYAYLLWEVGAPTDAWDLVTRAVQQLDALAAHDEREDITLARAWAWHLKGIMHMERGEKEATVAACQRASELARDLVKRHPDQPVYLVALASASNNLVINAEAAGSRKVIDQLDEAVSLARKAMSAPNHAYASRILAIALRNKAHHLGVASQGGESLKLFQESVAAARAAMREYSSQPYFHHILASNLGELAWRLSQAGDRPGAQKSYEEAVQMMESGLRASSDEPKYAAGVLNAMANLAAFFDYGPEYQTEKETPEAEAAFARLAERARLLAARHPGSALVNQAASDALGRRARYLESKKQASASLADYREAITMFHTRVLPGSRRPSDPELVQMLSWAESAVNLLGKGDDAAAVEAVLDQGIEIGAKVKDHEGLQTLATLHQKKGKMLLERGKLSEAAKLHHLTLETCSPELEARPWQWYLRQSMAGALRELIEIARRQGKTAEEIALRQKFIVIWDQPMNGAKPEGLLEPEATPDKALLEKLRVFMKEVADTKKLKEFTIPCEVNGAKVPIRFFLSDVPWPKDPLEDQARWLEEMRGVKVPADVRESVRKLQDIAHENKVSFVELCTYALNGDKDGKQGAATGAGTAAPAASSSSTPESVYAAHRASADGGNAEAQYQVGECFFYGRGVAKDLAEAARWYGKAALQGHLQAQSDLAWCCETGTGVQRDEALAVRWYRLAVEKGFALAQVNLARMCEEGRGTPKNLGDAVRLYGLAAAQGNRSGQNSLGVCYYNGTVVVKDYAEAARLFGLAAAQGLPAAEFNLALCYENGYGVAKSQEEARRWLKLAADHGHEGAKTKLNALTRGNEASEINKAKL